MTLTEEQFEEAMQGSPPGELDGADRAALGEARAIRERLRRAMASLRADGALADRIRAAVNGQQQRQRGRQSRLSYRMFPAAIAAAAVLVLLPSVLYFGKPAPVMAAAQELAMIHEANLAGTDGFIRADDRQRVAALFRDRLDFLSVAIPAGPGVRLEGGCVASIRNRPAASYLMTVRGARVTVIVTRQSPDDLGLACECGTSRCECYHKGNCKGCNLVSRQIGEYAYTAVGKTTQDELRAVLVSLAR